jgi:predicted Rossmann-fold nucleotide-binding protein
VLTSGDISDDPRGMFEQYPNFDIQVLQQDRGIKIELQHAPARAFVDGQIIRGINELLVAVVRDIVYVSTQLEQGNFDLDDSVGLTHAVFEILRNARILKPQIDPNLAVCWGGHSISRDEYEYTKSVGYQLGLRSLDICTGCGPGAMKGPMKGATIAHAKQRRRNNRYIGITEPGIIAAESPNPIVNQSGDHAGYRKASRSIRAHGTRHHRVSWRRGYGRRNSVSARHSSASGQRRHSVPADLHGPQEFGAYFEQIDKFLKLSLGDEVAQHYKIIVDDPIAVAHAMVRGIDKVRNHRLDNKDAFFFNWSLNIPLAFQQPFLPTHEAMRSLAIRRDRPRHELAADLRRAFSGIVAGNVKEEGVRAIEKRARSRSTVIRKSCGARSSAAGLRASAPHETSWRKRLRTLLPRPDSLNRRKKRGSAA